MDVRESLACQVPRYSLVWLSLFNHGYTGKCDSGNNEDVVLLQGTTGKAGSPGEVGLQGLPVSLNVEKMKCIKYMHNCYNDCEEDFFFFFF